jgi:hypothetical protein
MEDSGSNAERRGLIVFALLCLVLVIIHRLTLFYIQPYFLHALPLPPALHIGDDPPWYYIHKHFIEGVAKLVGLVLSIAVCAAAWIFSRRYAWLAVCLSLISYGGYIAESAVIYFRCPNLFDASKAVSAWPTFNDFINDSGLEWAFHLGLLSGLLLLLGQMCFARLRKKPDIQATNGSLSS